MANKGTIKYGINPASNLAWTENYVDGKTYFCSFIYDWNIKSQDVVNGISTIAWKISVDCTTLNKYDSDAIYIEVGGPTSFRAGSAVLSSTTIARTRVYDGEIKEIASGEFDVEHNASGSKTLSEFNVVSNIYGAFDEDTTKVLNITGWYTGYLVNITLDAIAKQGAIRTAPNFNDEESPTITYEIPKESTAAWVGIAIAGSTMTIPYRSVKVSSTTYTFTFTQAEQEALWAILARGVHTAEARFYIKTTCNGKTLENYKSATLEIINFMPTQEPEIWDTNPETIRLTGNKYTIVRHESVIEWKTGGKAYKGASIATESIKNGDATRYGATGTMSNPTSPNFTFTIIDNFGRSTVVPYNLDPYYGQFIEYVKLTCFAEVTPMTAAGEVIVTLRGKYYGGNFSENKSNRLRMHYEIAKNNGEYEMVDCGYIDRDQGTNASTGMQAYFTYDEATSEYTYEFTIDNLEYLSVYDLIVRVSDELTLEPVEFPTILASTPIFDWGRTDFNFNVPVTIGGDLTVAGNITAGGQTVPTIQAQGTAGIWTYRTWSDGTAECWGKKDFTVNVTSQWGNMYTSGAISGSNINFPFGLFAETPVVNASLLVRSAGGILMAPGGAGSNIANMDQTGVYEIARGTSLSNAAYTINYDVKGRWK